MHQMPFGYRAQRRNPLPRSSQVAVHGPVTTLLEWWSAVGPQGVNRLGGRCMNE
jgi:hypothetical protein